MCASALGAAALGVVNPLLALIPLIDAGPGKDSACRLSGGRFTIAVTGIEVSCSGQDRYNRPGIATGTT